MLQQGFPVVQAGCFYIALWNVPKIHFLMFNVQGKNFGIADAFILAAANKIKSKIITGDPHFEGLENAIMIK